MRQHYNWVTSSHIRNTGKRTACGVFCLHLLLLFVSFTCGDVILNLANSYSPVRLCIQFNHKTELNNCAGHNWLRKKEMAIERKILRNSFLLRGKAEKREQKTKTNEHWKYRENKELHRLFSNHEVGVEACGPSAYEYEFNCNWLF